MGGGKISLYLAILLEKMQMQVKIVELSEAAAVFSVNCSPIPPSSAATAPTRSCWSRRTCPPADAFVALTDRDEDNLIISLYAMQLGLPKSSPNPTGRTTTGIAQAVGLDSVISPSS